MDPIRHNPIILFDDDCCLCTESVLFIITHDTKGTMKFAPLQSEVGRRLKRRHGMDPERIDTMVLIEGDTAYTESDAAWRIARHLDGAWKSLALLRVLPRAVLNRLYHIVARHRYRWFGRHAASWSPPADLNDRFLGPSGLVDEIPHAAGRAFRNVS